MTYKEYTTCRRQYQEIGRDLLLDKKHACLFYEPGKGKTYPVIDALQEIDRMKNGKTKVLIISDPDAIRNMWEVEIVPQHILPAETFLITSGVAIGEMSTLLVSKNWDVIIVDECHILKSNSSKIHKLIYKLCRNVEYAWGLTGTPRGNTDIDIWCQLQALHIGGQGKMSYSAWTRIYCDFETGWGSYGRFQKPVCIRDKYIEWWYSLLDDYCMFVDYDESDETPMPDVQVVEIPYKKTKEYEDAFNGIIEVGEFATTTTKMVAISKAHQVCNGYLYLPDESGDKTKIHRFHENGKLNYLNNLIDKCVIVYKYIADYIDLCKKFGSKATNNIAEFKKGGFQFLLLQCGMCKSFNLQDHCNNIIFYTLDYSFIKYKQMIHRCWRLGQKRVTKVLIFQQKDTVEKQIWQAVNGKQKMHDLYMSIEKSV